MAQLQITGLGLLRARLSALKSAVTPKEVSIILPKLSVDKLDWLRAGGRDFEAVTPTMALDLTAAFAKGLLLVARGRANITEPWRLAGEAWVDRVATRLATGGGEVKGRMKRLKASTIKRKGFAKIGVDTGALLRSLVAAKVVVK